MGRSVPVKPSFSAVKVPMFAMMNFLSVEQGSRPSRPVVIRPAGDGLAAPLAGATQWSAWKPTEFVPRGMRVAQGKLFSLEGCGHRSEERRVGQEWVSKCR